METIEVVLFRLNRQQNLPEKKLLFLVRLTQLFLMEVMASHGFGPKTFKLSSDSADFTRGLIDAPVREVLRWDWEVNDKFARQKFWRNCALKIAEDFKNDKHKKWLALGCFQESTDVEPIIAEGTGDLAMLIYPNVEFLPENASQLKSLLEKNCPTTKQKLSLQLGAMLHEMCHTFDLAHASRGIMGRDFEHVLDVFKFLLKDYPSLPNLKTFVPRRIFSSAVFLDEQFAVLKRHPWLNASVSKPISRIALDADSLRFTTGDSDIGFRLVQFWSNGFLVKHWEFETSRSTLDLGRDMLLGLNNLDQFVTVLIMDDAGSILKKNINVYDIYMNK